MPEEDPGGDELLVGAARRLLHDVQVRGIKTERGRRGTICHKVHPQQLHGDQVFRQAQRRR